MIVSDQVGISDEIKSFKAGYVLSLKSFNKLDKNLKVFLEKNNLKIFSKNALKLVNLDTVQKFLKITYYLYTTKLLIEFYAFS